MSKIDRATLVATLCLGLLLLAVLRVPVYKNLWTTYVDRPIFGRDFIGAYYTGALALQRPEANLYRPSEYLEWQRRNGLPALFDAEYPPLLYLLYTPFTHWPPHQAARLNLIMNHVLLIASVVLGVLGLAPPSTSRGAKAAAIGVLVPAGLLFSPSIDLLLSGQLGMLLLLLMTAFAVLYARGQRSAAAWPLALAISLKLTPLVLLGYLLIKRDFRTAIVVTGATVALNLLLVVFLGPAQAWTLFESYAVLLPYVSRIVSSYENQSVSGFVMKFFVPTDYWTPITLAPAAGQAISIVLNLCLLAVTFRLVLPRRYEAEQVCAELSPFILLQLLCLGRSWPHYHVYVLLAAGLSYAALRQAVAPRDSRHHVFPGLIVIILIGLLDGEVASRLAEIAKRYTSLTFHVPFLLVFLLWMVGIAALIRVRAATRVSRSH